MKKSLFLLIALVFALGICLVACDINGGDTHTHSFGEWVTIKKVTCSDEGEMARYCDCGEEQIETLPPNGEHTEVIDEAVAPTCTKSGLTDGKHCSVCNTILVQQDIIPALEHTYNTYYSFDNNFHWYACRDCGFAKDKAEHQVGDDDMCTLCDNLIGATEGVIYEKSNDGTYAIVVEYNGSAAKVIIPDTYEGLPVTTIYSDAFKNNDSIISVIFPDSLTSIGDRAFYDCTSLSSVVFGDSLTSIGSDAFYDCDSLSSVVLPDSLTSIGHRAFTYCHSLISVVLPDSLTSIGSYAFDSCDSLQFNEYENGKYLGSESNPYFALIEVTTKNLSSYTIHEDTVIIAGGVFKNCERLTSITIPDNVTSIGGSAFSGCHRLSSVVFGDSLTSIGDYAFYYCYNLSSVVLHDSLTSIGSYAFSGCDSLSSVVFGDSLTSIGSYAFSGCDSLSSVVFGDSLTSIGDQAFYDCTSLSSVVFGDSLTSIGSDAFYDCDSLSSVVLPDSLTFIGSYAFYSCNSLSSVVFGDSLTSIGSYAFDSCDSLQFNEYENGKYLGSESNPYFALIEVTTKNLSSYTIHEDTVIIANGVFYGFGGLTSITIPDNVTSIGSSAFRYCTSLSSVVLPDSLTSIGHRAFDYCTSLTDVYYTGSEEEWQSIDNYYLINAEIHYNYVPEN